MSTDDARARLVAADHGVLSTLDPDRGLHAVPVCFAMVGDRLVVPVDRVKAKRSTDLRRTHNLALDPRASLLCEHWDRDDWSQLWWVRVEMRTVDPSIDPAVDPAADPAADPAVVVGETHAFERALRDRYVQYRTAEFAALLVFDIVSVSGWAAAS
jgi:Pyridoxamine 5'-phosphate oxidase